MAVAVDVDLDVDVTICGHGKNFLVRPCVFWSCLCW